MKKHILAGLLILGLLQFFTYAQKDPKTLVFSDIEFHPEKPKSIPISKNILLYLAENHDLPSLTVDIYFRNGSLSDPADKVGLASLTLELLSKGGTRLATPSELEDQIDFLGSSIRSSAGEERSYLRMSSLSKNFNATWNILLEIIQSPRFGEERLDVLKKKELETIRRQWDRPTGIAFSLFAEILYGKNSPEARRMTSASINAISGRDIRDFYQQNIKNSSLIIAVTGDFKPASIIALVKKSFAGWKGNIQGPSGIEPLKVVARPGIYFINKDDLTQSIICAGHMGLNRLDPDNVEINVLNFIYGSGSFNSRVMREVRSNRGLAYSAYGDIGMGRDKGLFMSFAQTKNESTGEVVRVFRGIMEDITKNPVSQAELETAKKYEQNSFIHRFDSATAVIREYITRKLMGYPDDYLETYIPRIKKVNQDKVLQMAQRSIHPEELVILVVGKKSDVWDQLRQLNLGEITELQLPRD